MDIAKRVLELAVQIQQIAAPTFEEQRRAEFVLERFQKEELLETGMDETGNVYARLPGKKTGLPVVISAHLDTVFPSSTPLDAVYSEGKISAPGIGDNSLGVAGLFGLVWSLRAGRNRTTGLPGDIWLAANTCEEGLGDLRGMRKIVERFREGVRAYVIVEGMALGQVYNRGLGVRRYRISVHTRGGHSWVDYGAPSAVHELARLITRLTEIPLPRRPRTTLNVGVISGGTSINTIAPSACLELDLRSEDPTALSELSHQVAQLVKTCCRQDATFQAEVIGDRPAGEISADHPLVQLALKAASEAGLEPNLNIGSTDANIPLSLGYPAVTIGLSNGFGAHTAQETLYTEPVNRGVEQLVRLVRGIFSL